MVTTSWIWSASHGGVNGVVIDPEDSTLMWLDDVAGCACGDNAVVQTYAQFYERGPVHSNIPEDVLDELRASIQTLEAQQA